MKKKILIVAGEVSGDLHSAGLVRELKKIDTELEFWGIGGEEMRAAGVRLLYHIKDLSFLGFWEVVRHLNFIRKVKTRLLKEADSSHTKLAILTDYPGFNLRLAGELKKRGGKIIYYISPQIWAWGEKRIEKIKRWVDKMIVFFPFEKEIYEKNSVRVEWVGHPLLDMAKTRLDRQAFYKFLQCNDNQKFIGLFPGSRPQEINQHLPVMLKAAQIVHKVKPDFRFLLGLAPGLNRLQIEQKIPAGLPVTVLENHTYEIMSYSELLLVKSGTSTLEAALCGTPFIVLYRVSPLSYLIAKRVVKVPYLAMPSILAGRQIVPEFIQGQAQPGKIAAQALELLNHSESYQGIKRELASIGSRLGSKGAYQKAARAVAEYL